MKPFHGPCSHRSVGGFHLMKDEYSKQHMILQHMMSHYRRVYSAKCDVDTSTPFSFKPRYKPKPRPPLPTPLLPVQSQLTRDDIRFLESLAGDIRSWWTGKGIRHPVQHPEPKPKVDRDVKGERNQIQCPFSETPSENREWCLYEPQHSDGPAVGGVSALSVRTASKNGKELNSRCTLACRTMASSRLREMSVYHPPRRRVVSKDSLMSHKMCSQSSSKSSRKISHVCPPGNYSGTCKLFANEIGTVIDHQREELLYLQFVQDITQEILNSDIYCNEGVTRIFAKHIYLNRSRLRMDKMRHEIEKLRKQIGIPGSKCSLFGRRQKRLSNPPNVVKQITKIIDRDSFEDDFENEKKIKHCFSVPTKVSEFTESECKPCVNVKKKQDVGTNAQKKNTNVLVLLQEMGFDDKMAQEICLCMSEKDITKFHFAQNDSITNDYWFQDFAASNQVDENEDPEKLKCVTDFYSNYLGRDNTNTFFHNEKEIVQVGVSDSLVESDTTDGFSELARTAVSGEGRTSKESGESASTFGVAFHSDSDVMDNSKSNLSDERNETNVPASLSIVTSPLGSDYSSMKDNNESVCEDSAEEGDAEEADAEEADEGRESVSEIEEDIPEELSESSSSGISQLTERLKKCSVTMNTVLQSRAKERRNVVGDDSTVHLKKLIL